MLYHNIENMETHRLNALIFSSLILGTSPVIAVEDTPSIFTESKCWGTTLPINKPTKIPPPILIGDPGPYPYPEPINCESETPVSMTCSSPKDDLFLNPFAGQSAHHRPIGCDAQYADDNHPITRIWNQHTFGNINSGVPWGKSIFRAAPTDPVRTVVDGCHGEGGGGDLPITTRIPVPAQSINGPCGEDGVIAVFDPTTSIGAELRSWAWEGGAARASSGFQNSWRGLGHPAVGERRISSSASGTSTVFGVLRGHEVNTAGYAIEHVIQMSMDRFGNNALLGDKFVWPAGGTDGSCSKGRKEDGVLDCSGPIPYGQLFAIPRHINVDALSLSEPGHRLARALQRYGARPNDGTGNNVNMRADQEVRPEVERALEQDMKVLYPLMRAVTNDARDQTASGGGTPMAPNCAYNVP